MHLCSPQSIAVKSEMVIKSARCFLTNPAFSRRRLSVRARPSRRRITMRDSADFPDSESLIEEARFAYSEIYYWHKGQGKRRFVERFKEREESHLWRTEYLALVAEMVKPNKATGRDMLHVASEVLSGRREWAYGEKNWQGTNLSNWWRRIQELLENNQEVVRKDE